MSDVQRKTITALKVRQWLPEWEQIEWSSEEHRAKPMKWFYQFSMSANDLKKLTGVYPRTTDRTSAALDTGIQRKLEKARSDEIGRFVKSGYPYSDLSETKQKSGEMEDLRQPGWLPTAIVVNILAPEDLRNGKAVAKKDLVEIKEDSYGEVRVLLPESFLDTENWYPEDRLPIEVIDGQHRLWAFDNEKSDQTYELPVVAFWGLDLSWQAYLFYTINVKPKKINTSLAFDLYPLLRTEKWLAKFEGHTLYRETRAQELVDLLWSHSDSPWFHRINMLGERGHKGRMVTQAAWVRSLLVSFVKRWEGPGVRIGGLFGSTVGQHDTVLPWNRADQAAFIIVIGQLIKEAIELSSEQWAEALRDRQEQNPMEFTLSQDEAYFSRHMLMNQDQGLRTFLQIVNDVCYVQADELALYEWTVNEEDDEDQIRTSVRSLKSNIQIYSFLADLSETLATYDWRASSGPGLSEDESTRKAAFRGSGGYRELRRDVLKHIADGHGAIAPVANEVKIRLGF